jgi:hypothetical protein
MLESSCKNRLCYNQHDHNTGDDYDYDDDDSVLLFNLVIQIQASAAEKNTITFCKEILK